MKKKHQFRCAMITVALVGATQAAFAAGMPTLDVVEVKAGAEDLMGEASSATEGTVGAKQLETRPLARPAEVLEVVPGVIITQHSGDGKANQYFLRGFNLDHGTDFAPSVNGIAVNMPTHAHGQGYSDLNFLIPELVERVRYKKGPYSVEEGDFAAAGAAHIEYFRKLPSNIAEIGIGENGFRRALLAIRPRPIPRPRAVAGWRERCGWRCSSAPMAGRARCGWGLRPAPICSTRPRFLRCVPGASPPPGALMKRLMPGSRYRCALPWSGAQRTEGEWRPMPRVRARGRESQPAAPACARHRFRASQGRAERAPNAPRTKCARSGCLPR